MKRCHKAGEAPPTVLYTDKYHTFQFQIFFVFITREEDPPQSSIVTSVLTESESLEGLQRMADGLMERYMYKLGKQQPPHLLYTDRDCCSSKFQVNLGHAL